MASFSVVSNISASNAQANLNATNLGLQRAITRLSSGYRINQAGDDAAGFAVANGYRSTQAVLNQGVRNANDGLSTLQIKDGALSNIATLLDRLSTLATQAANINDASAGNNQDILDALDAEFTSVKNEIDREANVAAIATGGGFSVFISNDAGSDGKVTGTIAEVSIAAFSMTSSSISSATDAQDAVAAVKTAVTTLAAAQGSVGALQNRLQFAISLSQSQLVSYKAAESRIRDANVAEEAANLTRYTILTQSGVAALAQANQQSSAVLALLK